MDDDLESLKVQLLSEYWQSKIDNATSLIVGGFIALLVLLITIFYEGKIDVFSLVVGSLALYATLGVFALIFIQWVQNKQLDYIEYLLKKVDEGESLPPLIELKKMEKDETLPSLTDMKEKKSSKEEKIMTSSDSLDDSLLKSPKASFFVAALLGSLLGILGNLFVSLLFEDWMNNLFYLLALIVSGIFVIVLPIIFWKLAKRYAIEYARQNRD
jgi:hypothetical protein